jgi:phospholipid transport system substrate-binding protein
VKTLIAFACAAFLAVTLNVRAAEMAPDQLIKSIADDVLSVIRTTKDKRKLREAAEWKVLPYFDFHAMTQVAVGPYWRGASPDQQKALADSFRTLLLYTYTASLSAASSGTEAVDVKSLDLEPNQNNVVVRTTIKSGTRQPFPVDYWMEKGPTGWRVYEVVVADLPLVTNYHRSFVSEVQQWGVDGLVKALQAKNRELAQNG